MYFRCQNCGGNVIYSPERGEMYCPYCNSEKSESTEKPTQEMSVCPNCGGEVPVKEHTLATKCPYCSTYLILDPRMEGEYKPAKIIPFKHGKEQVKNSLREKFKKSIFAPTDFLSEAKLERMQGNYVPYWFFDYDTRCNFRGEGTRSRKWVSGNTEFTEISHFAIVRDYGIPFRKVPVDASIPMPDDVMDLMEPYDYAQMQDFDPKFLSGFDGEKYNITSAEAHPRAKDKIEKSATQIMRDSYAGFDAVVTMENRVAVERSDSFYGLIPIWEYHYAYQGKDYPFYVNGETGKIVGAPPVSKTKVIAYTVTVAACLAIVLACIPGISMFL